MTNLKCLRIAHNMTQSDVERLSGVPRWKISLAEAGRFALTESDASALAAVFDVSAATLLHRPSLAMFGAAMAESNG